MEVQQDLLQTDMTDKTEAARRFLEEALADFRKGRLQEAAEKMTVSGTLVREMIGFIKWEELNRPVQITADATFRHRPERHVMWYELKEKYLPEREHRNHSLNTEKTAGALPEKIPERETQQEDLLSKACIEELGLLNGTPEEYRSASRKIMAEIKKMRQRDLLELYKGKLPPEASAPEAEETETTVTETAASGQDNN